MAVSALSHPKPLLKGELFVLFLVLETAAIAMLPLSASATSMNTLLTAHAAITTAMLAGALLLTLNKRTRPLSPVLYALFAMGAAILVSTLWHMDLVHLSGFDDKTPQGISAAIFFQALLRVLVALALMKISGATWQSMYLQKGNLKLSLAVGLAGLFAFGALAYFLSAPTDGFMRLLPWILLFVLSNGFAEELLFRGLLLKRLEPLIGSGLSNLLLAIVFTLVHAPVTYVPDTLIFLLGLFPLALLWGYLMQKTNCLWGSALFHAGADCLIFFGIIASFGA